MIITPLNAAIFTAGLVLLACGAGWAIIIYNGIVQVKNNTAKAWKNIDVLLVQRHAEFERLASICSRYSGFEKEIMQKTASLRDKYDGSQDTKDKISAENDLSGAAAGIFAMAEANPQLKADVLYLNLAQRIKELESDIADRRVFYNQNAAIYNTSIKVFPQSVIAGLMGFKPVDFLAAEGLNK